MNVPTPTTTESFDRYSIRAQRELFQQIRDPFERMRVVRHTWRQHRGPTDEEQLADRVFSPDKYQKVADVCVFSEHETTDSQGQPRKYDLRKLAKIVRYCNERALEHEAFAALADVHTSNPGDPNPTKPRVLGYAGPYRLGLIGNRKPTWAIFTDEYRMPGEAETFNQRNRRSVELWTDRATGRMWFDPITTCGADAPRLPLPSQYALFNRADMELERYTATAPGFTTDQYNAGMACSPGGSNTTLRGQGMKWGGPDTRPPRESYESACGAPTTPTKQQYDAELGAPTKPTTPGANPMGPDDGQLTIEKIVEAVMALPPMQWAMQKMSEPEPGPGGMDELTPPASAANAPPPGAVPQPAPGGPTGGPPPGPGPEGDEYGDLDDLLGGDEGTPPGAPAGPDDDQYPEDEQERLSMAANQVTPERYAALRRAQDTLVRTVGQQQAQIQALSRESADAKRQARFAQLRADHPRFPIDDEQDVKPALYSLGGNMTDAEFDRHITTIERYAQKWVEQVRLPEGEIDRPRETSDKEQYAARRSGLAVQLYQAAAGTDNELDWEQALAAADRQLTGKP